MKTVFVGAGRGSRDVLELIDQGRLSFLNIELAGIVDIDPGAPAIPLVQARGGRFFSRIEEALAVPELELVVELTGRQDVLDEIYRHLPPGVRVMDHVLARVFWDLDKVVQRLKDELSLKTELEAQMAEERARLQEILDTVPDMVMVLDEDMRIVRVNRRFEIEVGRSREEVQNLHCYDVLCRSETPGECKREECLYLKVLREGTPIDMVRHDIGTRRKDGYYQVTANPIFNDEGKVIRVVETSREITEQVLLKRETEESARRFQQILDVVHAIITVKDMDGRYQLVNPHAAQTFGKRCEEMLGYTDEEIFPHQVSSLLVENDRAALRSGQRRVETLVLKLGGTARTVITETFPLTDYKGDRVGVCMVARDDTRRQELQRELLKSERLAAVGKLAAGVAHELNNPLTGILTFVEDLLVDAGEEDPRREDYEVILNETMRCRRIVRDLLDFSRQQAPERKRMDINAIINRTVTMVKHQASFQDIVFELELEDKLPELEIDANQIQQAILNLVINSRDAVSGNGVIAVRSRVDGARGAVVVSVTDDGCGIPPERLKEIFKPFYSTKGEQGNGLGLPAVESIISQHGGTIDLESKVDAGTTFRLYLPLPATG